MPGNALPQSGQKMAPHPVHLCHLFTTMGKMPWVLPHSTHLSPATLHLLGALPLYTPLDKRANGFGKAELPLVALVAAKAFE